MAAAVKALSEAEFQAQYGEIFEKHWEASNAGRWIDKQKYSAELERLAKARWG